MHAGRHPRIRRGASMRMSSKIAVRLALLLSMALAACSGTNQHGPASVRLRSTAIVGRLVPAQYTCDGKNIRPPLEWGPVPSGTGELALFLIGFKPVAGTHAYSLSVNWAVSGVDPSLHRLPAGQLPAEAHEGLTSNGTRRYSICPKRHSEERYQFEVYGLPTKGAILPNFAAEPILATLTGPKGAGLVTTHGSFAVAYKRP